MLTQDWKLYTYKGIQLAIKQNGTGNHLLRTKKVRIPHKWNFAIRGIWHLHWETETCRLTRPENTELRMKLFNYPDIITRPFATSIKPISLTACYFVVLFAMPTFIFGLYDECHRSRPPKSNNVSIFSVNWMPIFAKKFQKVGFNACKFIHFLKPNEFTCKLFHILLSRVFVEFVKKTFYLGIKKDYTSYTVYITYTIIQSSWVAENCSNETV